MRQHAPNNTELHSEQHKLLDALVLLKATTIAVNSRAVMGVFIDEWAALQRLPTRPTVVRVQTRAGAKDARMTDPWVPSALLTARHAPGNASTQGLYEFLPDHLLRQVGAGEDSIKEETNEDVDKEKSNEDGVLEEDSGDSSGNDDKSMLSKLLNRSWWRGRASQHSTQPNTSVAAQGHPALRANRARHQAATEAMLNATMHEVHPRDHASLDTAEEAEPIAAGDEDEGKAFWEEGEDLVVVPSGEPVTRTVGMGDEDEDRAALRTVPVHMREAYDDGDDDPR